MEVTANGYLSSRLSHGRAHEALLYDDYPQREYRRVASPARSEGGHRAVTLEEMRTKLSRMKKELDLERARNRQYTSEREQGSRHLKSMYEREWARRLESIEKKMKSEMEKNLASARESVSKEKDLELRQVLRYKDEEVRNMQSNFDQEKEDAVRVALELQKIALSRENSISCDQEEDLVESLKSELESVKSTNKTLEEKYKKKCASENTKEAEIKRLREDYDIGLSRVMQESKIAVLRDLHDMKVKEKLLQKTDSSSSEAPPAGERRVKSEKTSAKSSERVLTRQERANIESALLHSKSSSTNHTFTIEDTSDTESAKRPNSSKSLHGYRPVVDDDEEIDQLHREVDRLESKLVVLETENETLKKKQEDQKPLEEKIRSLKRRNAELAAMARRLEEKAKHLQQENLKKPKDLHHNEVDHMKRMFARQRARDLAEYAKNMLARDKEIEELRKKCQELAEQLGNQAIAVPENVQMYQEKEELENIIKQSAKERLLLERQVIKTKPDKLSEELRESRQRIHGLEELNRGFEDDIVQLRQQLKRNHELDEELHERTSECENLNIQLDGLTHNLNTERLKVHDLEEELHSETVKNNELTSQVSGLQERLKELQKFEEDVQSLQKSLSESQNECTAAKEQAAQLQVNVQRLESECTAARDEASELQSEVEKLESLLKHLQECAEQNEKLESEHEAALCQLKDKQDEVTMLQKAQSDWKKQTEEELSESQSKLERLTAELDVLSLELERNKTKCSSNSSIAIQTDQDDESSVFLSNGHLPSDSNDLPEDLIRSKSARLAESAKSLDTGFSEGEEDEFRSPLKEEVEDIDLPITPETFHRESTLGKELSTDPELSAISQRLRELEAAQSLSEDEITRTFPEGENFDFMSEQYSAFSNKSPYKMENGLIPSNSRGSGHKGPLQVYVAKYSYDPYNFSPNDNPDTELPLNAGDYILIHGEMDEDGFFEGELIDGRRGLVPCNFIQKVADEDLQEFHNAMAMASHHSDDDSYVNSFQHDLEFNSGDELDKVLADMQIAESAVTVKQEASPKVNGESRAPEDGEESLSLSLSTTDNSMTEKKTDTHSKRIPCPVKLKLDRQLTSSVLVSWSPPEGLAVSQIQAYHVFLDGEFKTSVRGRERTKALVENVDASKIHRVSVRTVTSQGRSEDAQCTMLFGKDAIPAPSKLEVLEISANTALLSWLPGNSSYNHVICVNGEEIRRVTPNICSTLLSGLAPSTKHKVSVQAKNVSSMVEASKRQQELLTASVEFMTLAGGIPDPPLDVQLEAGPQEGTLLLTWLPVTITPTGTSNGTTVAGYSVYADGKQLREVTGPTNDHAVLTGTDFQSGIPKVLTIRTIAVDRTESVDSNPVRVQHGLVKELSRGVTKGSVLGSAAKPTQMKPGEQTDTDEEIEAAFREEDKVGTINPYYKEEVMETSSSELSDIQEVEEENLSETADNEHNQQRSSPRGEKKPAPKHGRHGEERDRSPKSDMLAPDRVVPHIQITRDSSSERGTSFEAPEEEESAFRRPAQRISPDEPRPRKPSPSPVVGVDSEKQEGYRESPKERRRPTSGKSDSSETSARRSPVSRHHGSHSNHNHSDSLDQSGESVQELLSNDVVTKKKIRDDIPESELIDYEDNGEGDSMAEAGSDIYDDKHVRLFIALFDYDPVVMSPNVDAIDEELPFKEGQLIKVYGDKDADGFFRGSCNNHMGYVPCNMVSEVQVDDPDIAAQLLQESQSSHSAETWDEPPAEEKTPTRGQSSSQLTPSASPTLPPELNLRKMVALYDYDPQELSPNVDAEVELCFKAGDIIMIFGDADEDGFFQGELNGIRGLVPSNFITPASPADDEIPNTDSRTPLKTEKRRQDLTNDISSNKNVSPEHFLNGSEDKKKRPKGILAKGKNIFKKFSR